MFSHGENVLLAMHRTSTYSCVWNIATHLQMHTSTAQRPCSPCARSARLSAALVCLSVLSWCSVTAKAQDHDCLLASLRSCNSIALSSDAVEHCPENLHCGWLGYWHWTCELISAQAHTATTAAKPREAALWAMCQPCIGSSNVPSVLPNKAQPSPETPQVPF